MRKSEKALKTFEGKKAKARAGEFWSINTKRISGHKAEIRNKKQNGKMDVIVVTHAPITHGKKNIKLNENPELNKKELAYILAKKETIKPKSLGKKQNNMKVTNKVDKSIIRNIANKK